MTTLVEEMARAIALEPDFVESAAQAALDCVLKRLREPDEGMVDYVSGFGGHSDQETIDMIRAVATHLDQERRGK
jgi:hypothetical protein